MWLRISDEICLPVDDVVGFFRPESVDGFDNSKARAVLLTRDGRSVASPFGPKALANRLKAGGGIN